MAQEREHQEEPASVQWINILERELVNVYKKLGPHFLRSTPPDFKTEYTERDIWGAAYAKLIGLYRDLLKSEMPIEMPAQEDDYRQSVGVSSESPDKYTWRKELCVTVDGMENLARVTLNGEGKEISLLLDSPRIDEFMDDSLSWPRLDMIFRYSNGPIGFQIVVIAGNIRNIEPPGTAQAW